MNNNDMPTNSIDFPAIDRVVIDLEATCGFPEQKTESEIIEIGAVFSDLQWNHRGEFNSFIKPTRNPLLTAYCKDLTSISQSEVDSSPGFHQVMIKLQQATKKITGKLLKDLLFCSWGNYDRNQFIRDCDYYEYQYPFGGHTNLKSVTSGKLNKKGKGVGRMLKSLGLKFIGTAHRGIDDARMIRIIAKTKNVEIKRGDTTWPEVA